MKHGAGGGANIGWWSGVGVWLVVGCTVTNPAYDALSTEGGSGGSGGTAGASSDSATSIGETGPTSAMSGSAEGGTGSESGTSLDGSTGPEVCESAPLHPEDYQRCDDGMCNGGDACIEADSPEPVEYMLSACAPSCFDDCDCPAPPQDRAQPSCDDGRCALDCSERPCPGNMVCADGQCLRADAYGPCGESCLSGYCFGFVDGMGMFTDWICPVTDCLDEGGVPDGARCPPPSEGDAVPQCFEPQNPPELAGTGWCVLTCTPMQTCPLGMECVEGDCLHPV